MSRLLLIVFLLLAKLAQAEVYLSPLDGSGTELNPFIARPIAERLAGVGCTEQRPDATKAAGFMLCASNGLPSNMTGIVMLGAARSSTLSAKAKSDVLASTSKEIRGTTVEDAIKELVIPRLPRPKSGIYEIHLGSTQEPIKTAATFENDAYYKGFMVASYQWGADLGIAAFSSNEAWAATLATETFTASDGTMEGCQSSGCTHDWTEFVGSAWAIASNQAVATGSTVGSLAAARMTTTLDSVNHTVSATFVGQAIGNAADGTNTSCALIIRKEANATQTFYRTTVVLADAGELNQTILGKTLAGTTTTLATDTTDFSNGNTVTVTANGSTISGQHSGGSLMSVTDGDITAGTYVGLRYFSDYTTGSPSCTIDNLSASDLTTAAFGPLRRRAM